MPMMSSGKLTEALTSDERRQLSELNSCLFGYIKFEDNDQCQKKLLIQRGVSYYDKVIKEKLKTAGNQGNPNRNNSNTTTGTPATSTTSGDKTSTSGSTNESSAVTKDAGDGGGVSAGNATSGGDGGNGQKAKGDTTKPKKVNVDPNIYCHLGHLHLLLEDFTKALSAYQKFHNIQADYWKDAAFLYGLGLVYFHFNAYKWATQVLQKLLYVEPGFKRASDVHLRLALMFKVTKQYDNSLKHFKLTLADSNPCICSKSEVRIHIAHLYEVQGKYKPAKEAYEQLIKCETLTPTLKAAGLRQLGWLFYTVGQLADKTTRESLAIQYLKASVDIDSSNGQAWYLLGRCFSGVGRVHDAFDAYRQSIDKSEANADTWCSIGVLYQQQNQPMDALQAYICAVQLDKSHSAAWADLGVLYETCNQPNDALTCYLNATRNTDVNANLAAKIKFLQQNLTNMPMQHFQNKSQTLPSIEEAWRLPIPAELTSRQGTTGPLSGSQTGTAGKPAGNQGSLSPFDDDDDKKSDKSRKRPSNEPMEMPPPPPQPSPSTPPAGLSPQQYHMMQQLMSRQGTLSPQQQQLLQQLQQQHLLSQQFKRQQVAGMGGQGRLNSTGSSPLPSSSLSPLGPGGPSTFMGSPSASYMPGLPSSSIPPPPFPGPNIDNAMLKGVADEKFPISSQDIAMAEDVLAQLAGDKKSSSLSSLSSLSSSIPGISPSMSSTDTSLGLLPPPGFGNEATTTAASAAIFSSSSSISLGDDNHNEQHNPQQNTSLSASCSGILTSSSSLSDNFLPQGSTTSSSGNPSIITNMPSGMDASSGNNGSSNNNTNSSNLNNSNINANTSSNNINNNNNKNNNSTQGSSGTSSGRATPTGQQLGRTTPSSSVSTSVHSTSSPPGSSRGGGGVDGIDNESNNDEDDDDIGSGGGSSASATKDIFTVSATKELGLVLKRSSADAALLQKEVKPAVTRLDTSMTASKIVELSKGQGLVHRHLISIQCDDSPPPHPPSAPCPPLPKESLNPPTPSVYLDNKKEAFSSQLQQFCHQQPVVVIRGIAGALKLDLGLFSTKSLVEANPDHPVEMRTQKQQAPDENFDAQGRRLWYCHSCRGLTSVAKYAQYQASSFQESLREEQDKSKGTTVKESDSDSNSSLTMKKKRFKTIKFGTNVDLSDENKWRTQLHELSKLPAFCRLVSGSNMLSHIGHTILGMNTVQLYMKVPGSRTPGHQENNNFCSVNVNIGPGDCEWFAVPDQYWGIIQDMCERNNINYLRGSWWPILEDLYEEDVPVYRFIQKPGDLVWIGPGTVHWVQAIGWCNNIAWNVGPLTYRQYTLGVERYEYNRLESYKSIVPIVTLSWNMAQNIGIAEPKLHNAIKTTLMRSLRQVRMTVDLVEDLKKEIKWHGRSPEEASHYCEDCEIEVFNILFVRESDGQFLVHCQDCALKASATLENFVVLNQYTLEELCSIYDNFKVHTPHQSHQHLFGMTAFS